MKGGDFKRSQRDFLLSLFNNNGGPKIRERDAHIRMADTFKDKDDAPEVFQTSLGKWGGSFPEVFFIKCPHHR